MCFSHFTNLLQNRRGPVDAPQKPTQAISIVLNSIAIYAAAPAPAGMFIRFFNRQAA
jgi:hypothetical protein